MLKMGEKPRRIASIRFYDDFSTKFVGPLRGADTLPEYFDMPYTTLKGINPPRKRVEEGKTAIKMVIREAQSETPHKLLGEVLFEYWGSVEAINCNMSPEMMELLGKSYVTAIEELNLDGQLETAVNEASLFE